MNKDKDEKEKIKEAAEKTAKESKLPISNII